SEFITLLEPPHNCGGNILSQNHSPFVLPLVYQNTFRVHPTSDIMNHKTIGSLSILGVNSLFRPRHNIIDYIGMGVLRNPTNLLNDLLCL
ncbi:MAG: hypothetical protein ACFFC6_17315, partial [Promethearchaeota archaeon]